MNHLTVGQIEKATQARVAALFQQRLGYTYLGNWIDQDNANIDTARLTAWLQGRAVADILISRALHELTKAAGGASKSLHGRNKAVYEMLRHGTTRKTCFPRADQVGGSVLFCRRRVRDRRQARGYAPVVRLLQASAALKVLIPSDELAFVTRRQDHPDC